MRALIVGAGIAGPVLAAFLRRLGMDVCLCEARSDSEIEGSFLGVAPNGMNVLAEIGAASEVLARGTPCTGFTFLNSRGERVGVIEGGENAALYGAPLVMVRRVDLHAALLDTAIRSGARVRFGARLAALDCGDATQVVARFDDGREETADFVVGCDGIRSRTRALVLPDSPQPAFLEQLDFGGYARAPSAPLEVGRNVMVFGRRAFFGALKREDGEVWWFHNGGSGAAVREMEPAALRAHILAHHDGDPPWIGEVIRSSTRILGPWPLHDILTIPSWHRGRVCVIGDAAHATSPSAGQGASLAIEDAMILARCLRDVADPERAFVELERIRRKRVEKIVRQSRQMGSQKVAGSALSAWARDRLLPMFLKFGAAAQREQYGYRIDWATRAISTST